MNFLEYIGKNVAGTYTGNYETYFIAGQLETTLDSKGDLRYMIDGMGVDYVAIEGVIYKVPDYKYGRNTMQLVGNEIVVHDG